MSWSIPTFTILLSSLFHVILGDARDFPFFISEADYPGIQRYIFTIGFSLTGLILTYYSWLIFQANKET
ncbi:MAG: hypothetical protein VW862_04040, partial [Euryarchaeota archaeon]